MKAYSFILFVFVSFAVRIEAQPYSSQEASSQETNPVVSGFVKVADHVKLPAKEAGVLVHLAVKEGSQVRAGQKIGQIDDKDIQTQKVAASYALRAAIKRYKDDVDIRYSDAAAAAAEADYQIMQEANKIAERAITEVDLRASKLNWDKMVLAAEKARKEQELAHYEAYMKQAELDAAKLAIDRRVISAPFDGVVEEVNRKQEEWVNPGDTILWMLRLDVMEVEGAVDPSKYDPHEIQGCEVTVEVEMARGRKESFPGRITKVSSLIGGHKMYNVRAEVVNRQEYGSWMLRNGMSAKMTIQLGTGGAAAAGVSAR
jgi:multidrug efflux pump subunit AcrA (membrane-fusion protein)